MKSILSLFFFLAAALISHGQNTSSKNDSLLMKSTEVSPISMKAKAMTQGAINIANDSKTKIIANILNAPIQGKDVKIAISNIEDISTSTQNKYVVHYNIINGGTEDFHSGYTKLRNYLYTNSDTRIPTSGDTLIIPNPQQTITSGNAAAGKFTIYSNFLYTNGLYKVKIMVDAVNQVAEANETNNTAEKSVSAHVPPPAKGTVTDIDGNVYNTIQIGTQTWMVENLKTTKLNDGTPIVNPKQVLQSNNYFGMSAAVMGNGWGTDVLTGVGGTYALRATNPAYCYYNDDPNNNAVYGKLYNLYAVNTGKLAPAGWHVATDADWDVLTDYVKPSIDKNLKSSTAWSNNTGNTNITGFTAIPSGFIVEVVNQYNGTRSYQFMSLGTAARFWTVTNDPNLRKARQLDGGYGVVSGMVGTSGFSVRCVKN